MKAVARLEEKTKIISQDNAVGENKKDRMERFINKIGEASTIINTAINEANVSNKGMIFLKMPDNRITILMDESAF